MGINGIIVIVCSVVVILITISVILYIIYATNKEKDSIQDIQITLCNHHIKNLTEIVDALEKSNSKDKD